MKIVGATRRRWEWGRPRKDSMGKLVCLIVLFHIGANPL
jgi:hypothetical protein